jgi:hypothetical protein
MKKLMIFVVSLLASFLIISRQDKNNSLDSKSYKKHQNFKIKDLNRSRLISFDENQNIGKTINQLKRRYPKKYNRMNYVLERDDFGYEPINLSHNSKVLHRI